MEKINCDNLEEFILKHIDSEEQLRTPGLFDEICRKVNHAIEVFEENSFYHNDLHHENIMVCGTLSDPDIYFIDFGNSITYVDKTQRDFRVNQEKIIKLILPSLRKSQHVPELQREHSFESLVSNASSQRSSRGSHQSITSQRSSHGSHRSISSQRSSHGTSRGSIRGNQKYTQILKDFLTRKTKKSRGLRLTKRRIKQSKVPGVFRKHFEILRRSFKK